MNYIGMDIHKKFTVAVVKDRDGNKLAEENFDNNRSNFETFLKIFVPAKSASVGLVQLRLIWPFPALAVKLVISPGGVVLEEVRILK